MPISTEIKLNIDEMREILRKGATHELSNESGESFLVWMNFISDPLNLEPGLPDLKIVADSLTMDESAIMVSFAEERASIRSLELQFQYHHHFIDLVVDSDFDQDETTQLTERCTTRPQYVRKWLTNLFLHSGLEKFHLQSIDPGRSDLVALFDEKMKVSKDSRFKLTLIP